MPKRTVNRMVDARATHICMSNSKTRCTTEIIEREKRGEKEEETYDAIKCS